MLSPLILTLFPALRLFVSAVPILHNPLKSQLVSSNPALSSVYFPLPSSVLLRNIAKSNTFPALRVPPSWSFSVGLRGDTFLPGKGDPFNDLNISVQLADGNPIPHWLQFDPNLMTLNGGTPAEIQFNTITVMASARNFTISDSFLLIISPHDLAITGSFEARNITTDLPFSVVIDDLEKITLDDSPVNASLLHPDIPASSTNLTLHLDTTAIPSLSWDITTQSLSGTGPRSVGRYTIPMVAAASFPDQQLFLTSTFTLDVFPSYFNSSWLPAQHIAPGLTFSFDLNPFAISEAKRDPDWTLSLDDNSSVPWVLFDHARLFLNGTIPRDIDYNARIVITAYHMYHNVTNSLAFDLVTDDVKVHGAKEKRLSPITSSRVFRKVLGFSMFTISVVIIALLSAIIYSRRHAGSRKRKSFKAKSVAYSYQEPKANSRNPIQLVFDNFSLSSNPSLGGRLTKTKAVFDAIRNRLRGERFIDSSMSDQNRQRQCPDPFGHEAKPTARMVHPQRPRKSKIGRPIAILNGNSGLFSDLVMNDPTRAASSQQFPVKELRTRQCDGSISLPAPTFPHSRFSKSYTQFSPCQSGYPDNAPRPSNPVLRSASDISLNDVAPAVAPKIISGPSSMKVGEFLANKRGGILRGAASIETVTTSSATTNKASRSFDKGRCSQPLNQPPLFNEENAALNSRARVRAVRPHFGDSSLEDMKDAETERVDSQKDSCFSRNEPGLINPSMQAAFVKHNQSDHIIGRIKRRKYPDQLRGRINRVQQQLDSSDPSTEEYFGSASNESEKFLNLPSVAMTVPSVYSDDQHNTSFLISSYSIAARHPFAFTPNVPKLDAASCAVAFLARQHNGAALPPWLRFNKVTNEFWGVTPDVEKGNAVDVKVDVWDPRTNNLVAGVDVEVLG